MVELEILSSVQPNSRVSWAPSKLKLISVLSIQWGSPFFFYMQITLQQPFWLDFPPAISGRKEQLLYEAIASKSEGTRKSYFYKCQLLVKWLVENVLNPSFPVRKDVLANYFPEIKAKSNSDSVITTTAAARFSLCSTNAGWFQKRSSPTSGSKGSLNFGATLESIG